MADKNKILFIIVIIHEEEKSCDGLNNNNTINLRRTYTVTSIMDITFNSGSTSNQSKRLGYEELKEPILLIT